MAGASCDLCGLPLLGGAVHEDGHTFCCKGCHRVWDIAEESGIESLLATPEARRGRTRLASERKAAAAGAAGARRASLAIDGMWCASCALVLEDALMDLPGVLDAEVSYAGSMARVTWDPRHVSAEEIAERVSVLGYASHPAGEALAPRAAVEDVFLRFFVSVAVGMWVMWPTLFVLYPAYVHGVFGTERALEVFAAALSLVVLLYGGWPFLAGAVRAARVKRATMDTLVALGTWSAWLYSVWALISDSGPTYFESATMITAIVLLGRWIEAVGTRDAGGALSRLAEGAVEEAWVLPEGATTAQARKTPLAQVITGMLVAVRAGERIPVDGTILEGSSDVDRSRLTGEPLPAPQRPGDEVWAGTLNLGSLLVVRAERTGDETLSGRLSALMEDAVFAKSNTQRLVDRISRVFVPVVIALAVGAAFVSLATGTGAAEALTRAVAVLVVACPCALGLATPLATSNAIAAGARHGLLVRGGPTLERSESIATLAFDKTGTLTRGLPAVVGAIGPDGAPTDATALALLAAPLELGEAHPVAAAILALTGDAAWDPATDIERAPGLGLAGTLADGGRVAVGGDALMAREGVALSSEAASAAEQARAAGELVIWVARNARVAGALRFADAVRPEAAATVAALHSRGVATAIVSGDAQATCDAVAGGLGIEQVYGDVLPHEKDAVLDGLAAAGPVGFVGDGINDAAALAAADLAIAIGGGSDVAVWGADVVLVAGDASPLSSLPALLSIAEESRRVIAQNLAWAFSYNLVTIPLAVSGRLGPIPAAAAMALSSIAVVANSARLSRAGSRERSRVTAAPADAGR